MRCSELLIDRHQHRISLTSESMPPRLSQRLQLKRCLVNMNQEQLAKISRQASTASSALPDDIYDIVIVGGGIAGLALTTSLCTESPYYHS